MNEPSKTIHCASPACSASLSPGGAGPDVMASSHGWTRLAARGVRLTSSVEELPRLYRACAALVEGQGAPLRHALMIRTSVAFWLVDSNLAEMRVLASSFLALAETKAWTVEDAPVPSSGWVCRKEHLREALEHGETFSPRKETAR